MVAEKGDEAERTKLRKLERQNGSRERWRGVKSHVGFDVR
jgi:hypothetical protein